MATKKIVFCDLVTSFGGVQRVMLNLLPELCEEFDITVIDPYANKEYRENLINKGVSCYFDKPVVNKSYIGGKGSLKWYFNLFLALPRIIKIRISIKKALKDIEPDIIYVNQLSALRLIGTLKLNKQVKLVYHAHGFAKPTDISKRTVNFINNKVTKAVAVSNSTADIMKQAGIKAEKITVCYNAVPIEEIEKKALQKPDKPLPEKKDGQTVFLLPAAMQFNKGFHLAIEALGIIIKKGYNVAIWFAGDIPQGGDQSYKENLKKMSNDLGVSERVFFLGWRKDIYVVINNADVIMLCSLTNSESFGMVLTEAMVLGKCCIGANIGGIPEVINDEITGLVFEPNNANSLSEKMERVILNKNLYGQAGQKRVKEVFSIENQGKVVINILKTL